MSRPEPLTPVDCDLRDFAFMPLDTMRLLDSDLFAIATGDEFKAAITLWCKAWQQVPAGSLPNDDRVLAHLAGAGTKWKKLREIALRGFVECEDGRLYHPVVCEKANEAWAKKQSYRERSKKGNSKRWGSQKDEQQQSPSDPSGTPQGLLEPPKGQGQGQGEDTLAKANAPIDSDAAFWANAKGFLGASKASLIGKWVGQHGREATAAAIAAAQVERAVDPVAFIQGRFRLTGRQAEQVSLC